MSEQNNQERMFPPHLREGWLKETIAQDKAGPRALANVNPADIVQRIAEQRLAEYNISDILQQATMAAENAAAAAVQQAMGWVNNYFDSLRTRLDNIDDESEFGLAATLEARTRGGTATMCGFDEYIASTPPRKYRRRTLSGTFERFSYSDAVCGSSTCSTISTYTGYCQYDAATCALTTAGNATNTGCISSSTSTCDLGAPNAALGDYDLFTRLERALINDLDCHLYLTVSTRVTTLPTSKEVLSDEDTEADAITRLLAGGGGTWSSWVASDSGQKAEYEQRTTLYAFIYAEAQYLVTYAGLTPSTAYTVHIHLFRRAAGSSDPWVKYNTLEVSTTTDGSGNLSCTGDIPNEVGYETFASSAYVIDNPA